MNTTFLATADRALNAAKLSQLRALVRKQPAYSLTRTTLPNGTPRHVLCFDGAREYADPAVMARFREITA